MPKQVGNQNRTLFVAIDYYWLIFQTLSRSLFVFVSHKKIPGEAVLCPLGGNYPHLPPVHGRPHIKANGVS